MDAITPRLKQAGDVFAVIRVAHAAAGALAVAEGAPEVVSPIASSDPLKRSLSGLISPTANSKPRFTFPGCLDAASEIMQSRIRG